MSYHKKLNSCYNNSGEFPFLLSGKKNAWDFPNIMAKFPIQIDWAHLDPLTGVMPDITIDVTNISNFSHFDFTNYSAGQFWDIIHEFDKPRPLPEVAEMSFIAAYITLGVVGLVGNLIMIYVITRTPSLRTARNLYIANLSVSDLTLCTICMPFTLIQIIRLNWPFGLLLCKMVPTFQATNVFVSTFSFSAIALDRYNVIVYSTRTAARNSKGFLKILVIWVLGFLLSVPWVVYTSVHEVGKKDLGFAMYIKCVEVFPLKLKAFCTIAVMVIQYLLPVITVTVVHARIHFFLKYHRRAMCANTMTALNQAREKRRSNRTTHVLIAITVVFAVSWLPLNIYNLIADFKPDLLYGNSVLPGNSVLAVCHAIAMSSACWNPLLYGWLNNTMRVEIGGLFTSCGNAVRARIIGREPVPSHDQPHDEVRRREFRHCQDSRGHLLVNQHGRTELASFGADLRASPQITRHSELSVFSSTPNPNNNCDGFHSL